MSGGTGVPGTRKPPGETSPGDGGQGGMLLVPWAAGMDLAKGYDTVSRVVLSSPFQTDKPLTTHEPANTRSFYTEKTFSQIESTEKMREKLQIGTEANVGYDAFSANHVGRFLQETTVDEYNLYFLIICYTQSTEVHAEKFELQKRFNSDEYDNADFRQYFGDRFVSGWVYGGYLIGLAEIKATSKQALKDVKEEVSANFKGGDLEAGGGFSAAWNKWTARTDVSSTLHVIYAGIDGQRMNTLAITGGKPDAPVTGGTGTGGTSPIRPHRTLTVKDVIVVEEDDDVDDDVDDDDDYNDDDDDNDTATDQTDGDSRHTGTQPRGDDQAAAIQSMDPVNYRKIEMNMQGLLNAATHMEGDVMASGGVPLFAVLHPYAPLYRTTSKLDVAQAEVNRKRELISAAYMKAKHILNSVDYALTKIGQFQQKKPELEAVRTRMEAVLKRCNAAWRNLNESPHNDITPSVKEPADSEIPAWVVEKTKFEPFAAQLNPALFTKLINEAADQVAMHPEAEARRLLPGYLTEVADLSVKNFGSAADGVTALRLALVASYDDDPTARVTRLQDLARKVKRLQDAWQRDSVALEASYLKTARASGLDSKALEFLKQVNPVMFGPDATKDKEQYGFAAFWIAFYKGVSELAMQSNVWEPAKPLSEILDYGGGQRWSDLAKAFGAEAAAIDTTLRHKLKRA